MPNYQNNNCVTFTENSQINQEKELVKLLPITNNALNHTLFNNQFIAPAGYKIVPPNSDGSFMFGNAINCLNLGLLNRFGKKSALIYYDNSFMVKLHIKYQGNYNTDYCFQETSTFSATFFLRISDLGAFLDHFQLDATHSVCATDVQAYFDELAIIAIANAVDEHGNINQTFIRKSFNAIGLFVIGNPVISDFNSARGSYIQKRRAEVEENKRKLEEIQLKAIQNSHDDYRKALHAMYTELSKVGMNAREIQKIVDDYQQKVNQSVREEERQLANIGIEKNREFAKVKSTLGLEQHHRRRKPQQLPSEEANSQSKYIDRIIVCVECGKKFTWTAGEQQFYETKGYPAPKRCKACKNRLKAAKNALPEYSFG